MALSGTINGTTNNEWIDCKIVWSATQSISNNTSTITATLYYIRTNTGYTTHGNLRGSISIGTETQSTVNEIWITETHWEEASTFTTTVSHNADGTKTLGISATGYINNTSLDETYLAGSITLDRISREASLLTAPNFTDEQNPTITYSNPAGNAVSSLQACISFDGDVDIPYRDVSKTGTSYTFNLTDAERNILRNGTSGNSRSVRFYLKMVLGGSTYYYSLTRTLTIVNANPVLSPTAIDVDTYTLALTGNANTFIKYYSNAQFAMNATAQKGASLKSYKVSCGGQSTALSSGIFANVESGEITFTATDSRGNSTTKTLTKTFINYVKLTCNMGQDTPTTSGVLNFTVSGNYFNGSFGATANNLTVEYRYKASGGSYSAWTSMPKTISGNKYTANVEITGLDYQTAYIFQARATDKLSTATTAEKQIQSMPVFDWDADDFRFNVPVRLNAGGDLPHKLLWQGKNYMNASQTAYLTEGVSEQFSGIVLVFSNYDATTGTANDYDWHCYYVPKRLVELQSGTGHCFNMMSQGFGDIASKYLYISDKEITGNDVNTTNGTRNGITYNNAKYVMRYVLGV